MFGVIVMLIILTGQRRGEIAALLESFYSHNQQTVTLGELNKNHLEHTFPVGAMAVQLIMAQIAADRRDSKFLFPSRTSIERPFNGWSKSKKEIDTVAKIAPWTLHDLCAMEGPTPGLKTVGGLFRRRGVLLRLCRWPEPLADRLKRHIKWWDHEDPDERGEDHASEHWRADVSTGQL